MSYQIFKTIEFHRRIKGKSCSCIYSTPSSFTAFCVGHYPTAVWRELQHITRMGGRWSEISAVFRWRCSLFFLTRYCHQAFVGAFVLIPIEEKPSLSPLGTEEQSVWGNGTWLNLTTEGRAGGPFLQKLPRGCLPWRGQWEWMLLQTPNVLTW